MDENKKVIPGLFYNNGLQLCEGDIIKNIYREYQNGKPTDMRDGDNDNYLRFIEDYKGTFDIYIVKYNPKYANYTFYRFTELHKGGVIFTETFLNMYDLDENMYDSDFRLNYQSDSKKCNYEYESERIGNIYDDGGFELLKELQQKYYPDFKGDIKDILK